MTDRELYEHVAHIHASLSAHIEVQESFELVSGKTSVGGGLRDAALRAKAVLEELQERGRSGMSECGPPKNPRNICACFDEPVTEEDS